VAESYLDEILNLVGTDFEEDMHLRGKTLRRMAHVYVSQNRITAAENARTRTCDQCGYSYEGSNSLN